MKTDNKSNFFKIQGIGFDTSTVYTSLNNSLDLNVDYVYTSIESNNDFLIRNFIKSLEGASLITSTDFMDSPIVNTLLSHITTLERDRVDLLLIDEKCLLDNSSDSIIDSINSMESLNILSKWGIKNPSTKENIEKIQEKLGKKVEYISLNICPLNFNYEIIEYCNNNNIYILGFNPFGGHVSAAGVIDGFTKQYLLNFISLYSDVVFMSGRDYVGAVECYNYLNSEVKGAEVQDISKYTLKKSVNKLYKPVKKVINTSSIISSNIIIPFDSPNNLYSNNEISIFFNKPSGVINIDKNLRTELEIKVDEVLNIVEFPKDCSEKDRFAISRYHIFDILKSEFKEDLGWNIKSIYLNSNIIGISATKIEKKKWYKKNKSSFQKVFLLAIDGDKVIFIEDPDIENSSDKNSKPN